MSTVRERGPGSPRHPAIRHDDGFPDGFEPLPPPRRERLDHAPCRARAEAGEAIRGVPLVAHDDLPSALAAHRHILGASGRARRIDAERPVTDDQSGRTFPRDAVAKGRQAARALHRRHFPGRSAEFPVHRDGAMGRRWQRAPPTRQRRTG